VGSSSSLLEQTREFLLEVASLQPLAANLAYLREQSRDLRLRLDRAIEATKCPSGMPIYEAKTTNQPAPVFAADAWCNVNVPAQLAVRSVP
jgi:hypothetical protein